MGGAERVAKKNRGRLPCTFEGCDRPRHAKKLCDPHYLQLRKTGTTWPVNAVGFRGRRPSFVPLTKLPCSFPECKNNRAVSELCHGHHYQLSHGKALKPLWQHAKLPFCRSCRDPSKPRTPEFFHTANNYLGLSSTCKECKNKTVRSKLLRSSFGVEDPDWYDKTLATQNGKCAICGTTNPGRKCRFMIDHDHATGKVRGLLCRLCNIGLGSFGDSMKSMSAAIEYVRKHS